MVVAKLWLAGSIVHGVRRATRADRLGAQAPPAPLKSVVLASGDNYSGVLGSMHGSGAWAALPSSISGSSNGSSSGSGSGLDGIATGGSTRAPDPALLSALGRALGEGEAALGAVELLLESVACNSTANLVIDCDGERAFSLLGLLLLLLRGFFSLPGLVLLSGFLLLAWPSSCPVCSLWCAASPRGRCPAALLPCCRYTLLPHHRPPPSPPRPRAPTRRRAAGRRQPHRGGAAAAGAPAWLRHARCAC
jgi:hypothetical protein